MENAQAKDEPAKPTTEEPAPEKGLLAKLVRVLGERVERLEKRDEKLLEGGAEVLEPLAAPGPAQPGPTKPGPAKPGPAQPTTTTTTAWDVPFPLVMGDW